MTNITSVGERTLILFKELQNILLKEKEINWLTGVDSSIEILNKGLGYTENLEESLKDVASIYRTMNRGANSFSDFYIQRADFDEQLKENQNLAAITDELWRLLEDIR